MNTQNMNTKKKMLFGGAGVAALILVFNFFTSQAPIPVRVEIRPDISNDSKARIFNTSDNPFTVAVTLENPVSKDKYDFTLRIDAGESKEIGWLEAREIKSGDIITVHHDGYEDYIYPVQ